MYEVSVKPLQAEEARLGDAGIVMVDIADPLCHAASLFSMADYSVFALTEPMLFHRLLEQAARHITPVVETVARAFPDTSGVSWGRSTHRSRCCPGALQRVCGEVHSRSSRRSSVMVDLPASIPTASAAHSARHCFLWRLPVWIRSSPRLREMALIEVRRAIGGQTVLFGNIEASEIELLDADAFEARVRQALDEGMAGQGEGSS